VVARRARRWLPRFAAAYLALALAAVSAPGFEVFPFFCWFLFPIAPGAEPRYELRVSTFEGAHLETPEDVQRLGVYRDPKAMDLWVMTQRLGAALEAGRTEEAARARRIIEGSFLCAPTRYRVDRVAFDPLARWSTGQVRSRETLAHLESRADCGRSPWRVD
jgi:hypothetical protein